LSKTRFRPALLISSDAGETLRGRPCAQLSREEDLRSLLEVFGYDLKCLRDLKDTYYGSNPIQWLRQNFKLLIINLKGLNEEYARIIPVISLSGLPCIFIGDNASMPSQDIIKIIADYFPSEIQSIASGHSSVRIPFFGCCGSFSALLDMNRRLELYDIVKAIGPEMEEMIHTAVLAELRNLSESETHGK
jgi:hypothetical protein